MGELPCMGYIGMCGPKGYGFLAVLVINRVSNFWLSWSYIGYGFALQPELKRHLPCSGYLRGMIAYNINDVVHKHRNKPKDIITVPQKEIFIVLPYLGIQSKIVTQRLKSCIYKFYGCFNPKIIFRNTRGIKSFSPIKKDSTAP